ncbi:MAG: 50S ribosomal protein L32 [Anaerolineales bacterium]|nr:50S ribosomal protein L32 [Anaerolineales bacterium]
MALPKKKMSRTRSRHRRAQNVPVAKVHLISCPDCGRARRQHTVCPHCGIYKKTEYLLVDELED